MNYETVLKASDISKISEKQLLNSLLVDSFLKEKCFSKLGTTNLLKIKNCVAFSKNSYTEHLKILEEVNKF